MIKKLTLTEDHLKLIEAIHFEEFQFDYDGKTTFAQYGWGIDQYNLFGGSFVLDDVALILGKFDQYIKGTENDPMGRQYPKELEDYMWDLYRYIWDNLEYIISLVFQTITKGGITAGTYKCVAEERKWTKVE